MTSKQRLNMLKHDYEGPQKTNETNSMPNETNLNFIRSGTFVMSHFCCFLGSCEFAPRANVPAHAADEDVYPEQPSRGARHACAESPIGLRASPSTSCNEASFILTYIFTLICIYSLNRIGLHLGF